MAASAKPSQKPSDLVQVATILGQLCLIGALGLALYLGITSLRNGSIAGCTAGGGCHDVIASKWGYLLGIPVSLLGAATYVAFLATYRCASCQPLHTISRWMILIAAAWFVCVQAIILKKFCPWCCITHTVAVLGVLFLWKTKPFQKPFKLAPALALAGVVALALIQGFGPERATTASESLAEGQGTTVSEITPDGPRMVSLHGGKYQINVEDFPSIGDTKTAKHVAVGLFDFTCPHCQHLHETLTTIHAEFGNQIAVVQLPGYYAPKGQAIHQLLLPIWKEDPDTYKQIADLLHEGTLPAVADQVQATVGSLVDPNKQIAWKEKHQGWSDEVLAMGQAIRETNRGILKSGKFPQLMIGDYVEAGSQPNAGHYYDLFKEHFGITRASIPKLIVEPSSINLGQVYAGTTQTLELTLRNPGGPTVNLTEPSLPPGMRPPANFPTSLASGEEAKVLIEAVPPSPGDLVGELAILSDAEPASINVSITANVTLPYKIEPAILDLGPFAGEPLRGKTVLTFDSPVKLAPPKANNPREFAVTIQETEPGLRYEVHVVATPDAARAGIHQTNILIGLQPLDSSKPWPPSVRLNARCRIALQPGTQAPKGPSVPPPGLLPSGQR